MYLFFWVDFSTIRRYVWIFNVCEFPFQFTTVETHYLLFVVLFILREVWCRVIQI